MSTKTAKELSTEALLARKTAELAALRRINRAIAEAGDLSSTLDLITHETTEMMGVQSCSIYLYNRDEDRLVLAASTGLKPERIGRAGLSKGTGLTGWAAAHNELVAIPYAASDPRFHRLLGSGESRFVSLMAAPLRTRGRVIGAANVQTTVMHEFSEEEIELFESITDLAATALEKAKLVHAAVVQEIHHRVKNNLQTIAMLLRLQVAQADQLTPQDILHETINRVLSIAAVHEILAQDHHTEVDLKRLVQQVTRVISASMTLHGQISISVSGDDLKLPSQLATNLALITNELLQNALEHSLATCQTGTVCIEIRVEYGRLTLVVIDNGRGLPSGFELERDWGLGLELVHTMVNEDLAGEFSLEPAPGGGTKAVVQMPLSHIEELTDVRYRFA